MSSMSGLCGVGSASHEASDQMTVEGRRRGRRAGRDASQSGAGEAVEEGGLAGVGGAEVCEAERECGGGGGAGAVREVAEIDEVLHGLIVIFRELGGDETIDVGPESRLLAGEAVEMKDAGDGGFAGETLFFCRGVAGGGLLAISGARLGGAQQCAHGATESGRGDRGRARGGM